MATTDRAEATARHATRNPLIRLLGRFGLAAYGLVYLVIAYLAVRVALGASGSGEKPSKTGALRALAEQPGGRLVLWLVAVSLAALTIWQLAEAVWGYRAAATKRRVVRRAASAGQAVVFAALAISAGKVAAGGSGNTAATQRSLTEQVFALPYGPQLIGGIGVVVMVVAAAVLHRGVTRRFTEDLDLSTAGTAARRTAIRLGRAGHAALAVAYAVVGSLVVLAAVQHDPDQPIGLDAALHALAEQPYGKLLLGAVAAGLALYGGYCLFDARYRRT